MRLDKVTDWCIDYTRGALWLATPTAWYRLLRPAPAFAPYFASTRRKFELALRAAAALATAPQAKYDTVLPQVLAPEPPDQDASALGGDSATVYSEAVMLHEARFLARAVQAAVPGAKPDARTTNFVARLEEHVYGQLSESQRSDLTHLAAVAKPELDEAVMVHRNDLLLKRIDWRFGMSAKRARASHNRAEPPAMERGFGIDDTLVGAMLALYDLFTSCGAFLRVAPFPLSRLTAALSTDSGSAGDGAQLEERIRIASEAGSASGALLRDLHTALLRVATGSDVSLASQPAVAQVEAPAGARPWPEATRMALQRAPRSIVDKDAAAAAQRLNECDYTDLDAAERIALLQGLVALALENNSFRDHMTQRVEDAADALQSYLPWESLGRTAASVDSMRPWDAWAAWASGVSPSPGRPLGTDLEGRRYWLFGGASTWGRIFVEETADLQGDGPASWGWYPWARLDALLAWLNKGGLTNAGERTLARALRRLPPIPDAQRDVWLAMPSPVPGRRTRREGMSDTGPDGYVGLVAPLLRGGTVAGAGTGAGLEDQVQACVQMLLSAVPLWSLDHTALQQHRLIGAAAVRPPGSVLPGWVLQELETMLTEHGALVPDWAVRRQAWRTEASACRTLSAVALAVSQLQDHLVKGNLMSRDSFLRMCRAPQTPPLPYLPLPGEVVVVSRTGLRAHCEHLQIHVEPSLWSTMRPTERFVVECAAHRRGDPLQPPSCLASMHTCWLLLAPQPSALQHLGGGFSQGLCVPIAIGSPLPDFVVDRESFDAGMRTQWQPGDRFKMFFPQGGSADAGPSTRRTGSYSKGTIIRIHLRIEVSAGSCADGGRYIDVDPWAAYEVEWDYEIHRRRLSEFRRLSPWQMDEDESNQFRKAVDMSRLQGASQRAFVREAQLVAMVQAKERQALRGASKPVTPPETEEAFLQLLSDFWQLRGKPLRVPTYFFQPLELYHIFCEVQKRGGYNGCCDGRKWRDVVHTLQRKIDLDAQSAAGHILKGQFEKILLPFELSIA